MTTIEAADGRWLTQATSVEESERIMVKSVSGADANLAEQWREASATEYQDWAARQEAVADPMNIGGVMR